LKILADRRIPRVAEVFGRLGEVRLFEPPRPEPRQLRDCELLLVRSVTRVGPGLLAGSRVRLVGTATSGVDHLDTAALEAAGISWFSARGCNARPVAEYVLSALSLLSLRRGTPLRGATAALVGCGQVGSCLAGLLEAVGVRCLRNDPPLQERFGGDYLSLDEVLEADIVSLHVPLTRSGPHPTWSLLDAARLRRMKPGAVLINTARGGVADEAALAARLRAGRLTAVLDVWEGEPEIDWELLRLAALGTPHIAGYSRSAKHRATSLLYRRLCRRLRLSPAESPSAPPAPPSQPPTFLPPPGAAAGEALRRCILAAYDIGADARALRGLSRLPPPQRGGAFQALRDRYPLRPEFADLRPRPGSAPLPAALQAPLRALGFALGDASAAAVAAAPPRGVGAGAGAAAGAGAW